MNHVEAWLSRKKYTLAEAAQILDCTPDEFAEIVEGCAKANSSAVRTLERDLGGHSYRELLKDLSATNHAPKELTWN